MVATRLFDLIPSLHPTDISSKRLVSDTRTKVTRVLILVSNQRSARPSSRIIEPDSSQLRTSTRMSMSHRITQTYSSSRVSKHIPPPIAIPQHPSAYRLFSSKSKRYRAMSSASMEALDGTAVSIELPRYFVIKVPCIYIDIDLASPIYRTTQL